MRLALILGLSLVSVHARAQTATTSTVSERWTLLVPEGSRLSFDSRGTVLATGDESRLWFIETGCAGEVRPSSVPFLADHWRFPLATEEPAHRSCERHASLGPGRTVYRCSGDESRYALVEHIDGRYLMVSYAEDDDALGFEVVDSLRPTRPRFRCDVHCDLPHRGWLRLHSVAGHRLARVDLPGRTYSVTEVAPPGRRRVLVTVSMGGDQVPDAGRPSRKVEVLGVHLPVFGETPRGFSLWAEVPSRDGQIWFTVEGASAGDVARAEAMLRDATPGHGWEGAPPFVPFRWSKPDLERSAWSPVASAPGRWLCVVALVLAAGAGLSWKRRRPTQGRTRR